MMSVTMISPGTAGTYELQDGTQIVPASDGTVQVSPQYIGQLLALGFIESGVAATDSTSGRPTINLVPGMPWFDLTLGIPIWRNSANSAWVNATGTPV